MNGRALSLAVALGLLTLFLGLATALIPVQEARLRRVVEREDGAAGRARELGRKGS